MKITGLYLLVFLLMSLGAVAQQTTVQQADTSAFQRQRVLINKLLEERGAKFGQYEQSLDMRTGIFGLQTKNDLRRTNDILIDIAKNDNAIFKQLKVLLDYKDLQKTQVESNANETKSVLQNYKMTIRKLQEQNDLLNSKVEKLQNKKSLTNYVLVCFVLVIVGGIYIFMKKFRRP